MYRIDWDAENNLAALANENAFISNEIRPVFSDELKNVGFDRYISFEESETVPLLWAIRYQYYYRGKAVARLVDNGCIKAPSIEILDESFVGTRLSLIDIDLWFDKNRKLMDQLVQDTLLRIYRVYMEWKDRVDYIDVAYSGGKDSMVLLDLVKRVLPHDSFFVAWINLGEWRFRRDSKGIRYHIDYRETIRDNRLHIAFVRPATAWETWIRTIGGASNPPRGWRECRRSRGIPSGVGRKGSLSSIRRRKRRILNGLNARSSQGGTSGRISGVSVHIRVCRRKPRHT